MSENKQFEDIEKLHAYITQTNEYFKKLSVSFKKDEIFKLYTALSLKTY